MEPSKPSLTTCNQLVIFWCMLEQKIHNTHQRPSQGTQMFTMKPHDTQALIKWLFLLHFSKYFLMAISSLFCPHKHGFGTGLVQLELNCLFKIVFGCMLSLHFKTEPKFDAVNLIHHSSYHDWSSDCPLVLHSMFCICSFDLNSVSSTKKMVWICLRLCGLLLLGLKLYLVFPQHEADLNCSELLLISF